MNKKAFHTTFLQKGHQDLEKIITSFSLIYLSTRSVIPVGGILKQKFHVINRVDVVSFAERFYLNEYEESASSLLIISWLSYVNSFVMMTDQISSKEEKKKKKRKTID